MCPLFLSLHPPTTHLLWASSRPGAGHVTCVGLMSLHPGTLPWPTEVACSLLPGVSEPQPQGEWAAPAQEKSPVTSFVCCSNGFELTLFYLGLPPHPSSCISRAVSSRKLFRVPSSPYRPPPHFPVLCALMSPSGPFLPKMQIRLGQGTLGLGQHGSQHTGYESWCRWPDPLPRVLLPATHPSKSESARWGWGPCTSGVIVRQLRPPLGLLQLLCGVDKMLALLTLGVGRSDE